MKYMMLMGGVQSGWKEFGSWPHEDLKRHVEFMRTVLADLTKTGELITAEGLTGPDQAKVVRAKSDGTPAVTDGPFPEAKEFLAGYWIIDVASEERAIAIAAHVSTAPGRGGTPMGLPIELRPVAERPPA